MATERDKRFIQNEYVGRLPPQWNNANRLSGVSRGTCKKFQSTEKIDRLPTWFSRWLFSQHRNSGSIFESHSIAYIEMCDASGYGVRKLEEQSCTRTRNCHACHFTAMSMSASSGNASHLLSPTRTQLYRTMAVPRRRWHTSNYTQSAGNRICTFLLLLPLWHRHRCRIEDSNRKMMVLIKV